MPAGTLSISYSIEGDLADLRLPAPRPPRMADRLWEHTCAEAFIARAGVPAYHEFNFSASGEWAAHAFARYRDGAPLGDEKLNPRITVRADAEKLELDALIRLDVLSSKTLHRPACAWTLCGDRGSGRRAVLLGAQTSAGQAGLSSFRRVCFGAR